MNTPAQKVGVVKGKKYIVTLKTGELPGHSFGSGVKSGDVVVIADDDGSILPYFSKVLPDGSISTEQTLISINRVDFTPIEMDGVKFEPATRTVEMTIITVERTLTPAEQAEIAAIIKKGN